MHHFGYSPASRWEWFAPISATPGSDDLPNERGHPAFGREQVVRPTWKYSGRSLSISGTTTGIGRTHAVKDVVKGGRRQEARAGAADAFGIERTRHPDPILSRRLC